MKGRNIVDNKEITRPTVMEISIRNFNYNVEQIRKTLNPNTTIMPIMKANAYGTYLNTQLDVINQFEIIGLATVDEGVELRNIGYKKEIFILNQPATSEINKIVENNLVIGLSSREFLKEVQKQNREIRLHLEIETGMGRTGIALEDISSFLSEIKQTKNGEGSRISDSAVQYSGSVCCFHDLCSHSRQRIDCTNI